MRVHQWFAPVCFAGLSISAAVAAPRVKPVSPAPGASRAAALPGAPRSAEQPALQAQKKEGGSPAEKTAGEAFKNVQVLKDIPASQFMPNMFFITEALGVGCEHCHVTSDTGPWPLEKDDKKEKQTAREMIRMMRSINDGFFSGQLEVTCATCHRGHSEPDPLPPLRPLGAKTVAVPEVNLSALPQADQVLDRYLAAIGGPAALQKLTTRKIKGVLVGEAGRSYTLQILQKAPGSGLVSITVANGTVNRDGFDGTTAWNSAGKSVFESEGVEGARIARDAQFFLNTDVKKRYPRRFTAGKEAVGEEDCYTVRAGGPGRVSEQLYFSVKSGLLLRRIVFTRTEVGRFVEQTDYSDFREVDGAKLPFTVARNEVNTRYTEKYSEIQHNVPIDDSIFHMPIGPQ